MTKIAVVESDKELADAVRKALADAGYEALVFPSAGRFLDGLAGFAANLALLDMDLPGLSGVETIKILRDNPATKAIPIVVLSRRPGEDHTVAGVLDLGADEVFALPLVTEIFLARVDALLRRASWQLPADLGRVEALRLGNLLVQVDEHAVYVKGKAVTLTALEFDLLVYFLNHRNRVLTRGLLLQQVWKSPPDQVSRTVDKRVESLRKKLGAFGRRIQTVSGVGYCLKG